MNNPLDAILPVAKPLAALFTDDVGAAWFQVQSWGDCLGAGSRLVACRWETVPLIDELIDDVVRAFARIALADWPHWYGKVLIGRDGENDYERNVTLRSEIRGLSRQPVHVLPAWLKQAAETCLRDEIPFGPQLPREIQISQLSLAVCPQRLVIVLCAGAGEAGGGATLVAAAEWLCRVAGAVVVLVVPLAWQDTPHLQRLGPGQTLVFLNAGEKDQDTPAQASGMAVSVTPLPGLPHPNSEAEKLLHKHIQADSALAPLLEFNQSVKVDLGQSYRVDLLCRTHRVVIEVDGSDHRVTSGKYCLDCERDYRLMKRGYLILRLPNELVFADPMMAITRIRDILRYRAGVQPGRM